MLYYTILQQTALLAFHLKVEVHLEAGAVHEELRESIVADGELTVFQLKDVADELGMELPSGGVANMRFRCEAVEVLAWRALL